MAGLAVAGLEVVEVEENFAMWWITGMVMMEEQDLPEVGPVEDTEHSGEVILKQEE